MEVLWEKTDTVFRLINIIANSAIVSIFYATFLEKKRKAVLIGIIYLAVMTVVYLIPFEMPAAFAYAMGIISVFFVSVAAEKGDIPRKIFLSVTIYLLNWIAGGIVNIPWSVISRITFMNPGISMDQDLQYRFFVVAQIVYVLLENAILLAEVKLVDRSYKNKQENMQWRELTLLISPCAAIMIGYWFSSFLMNAYERDTAAYIWNIHKGAGYIRSAFQIFSFLAILAVIRAYQEIRQAHEEMLQNALIAKEIEDLKSHVGSVEKYYKDVRAMKHDMNNHLVVVKRLIEQDDRKEAEKYLEAMDAGYGLNDSTVRTGNPVTDIIISEKKREAEELGIRYEADFEYPAKGNVEAFDICILLSNALTNAMEAARETTEAYIIVKGWTNRNAFLIDVKNSCSKNLMTDGETGLPVSNKKDREDHGFGLINMKRVAEKYYGTMEIKQDGNEVEMTAMLMLTDTV